MNSSNTHGGEKPGGLAEQREKERIGLSMPARLRHADGTVTNSVSMNISEGGMFIVTETPPEPGERLGLEILSLGGETVIRGEIVVCWQLLEAAGESPPGFGGAFTEAALQSWREIESVIRSAFQRDSILAFLNELVGSPRLAEDISAIQRIELSDEVQGFIQAYGEQGQRDEFIWKWVYQGLRLTALSSVDAALWEEVQTIKLLGVMFDVMLDDAADQIQDESLVEQMLLIAFESPHIQKQKVPSQYLGYLEFTIQLWQEIERRFRRLPRFGEFEKLLTFDYRQLLNCMRYALVVNNDPRCMNLAEHDLYQPHNMHMMVNATIDLMASPEFDARETGMLREVIWNAQVMGRIGNAVTTWQREIKDRDFTSGIFAMALAKGVLTSDDLLSSNPETIEQRILGSQLEDELLIEWGKRRDYINKLSSRLGTVDVNALVGGLENLIAIHLGSRGLK
jgi:hypothetical protein